VAACESVVHRLLPKLSDLSQPEFHDLPTLLTVTIASNGFDDRWFNDRELLSHFLARYSPLDDHDSRILRVLFAMFGSRADVAGHLLDVIDVRDEFSIRSFDLSSTPN
jgi:hypothetical protein